MLNLSNPYGDLGSMAGPSLPEAPPTEPAMTSSGGTASPYDALFAQKEQKYNLPNGLLKAIADQESNFRPDAKGQVLTKGSHKGQQAMGMFQFMPATWKGEGHTGDPFNPEDAAEAAAKKLDNAFKKRNNLGYALQDYYGRGTAPAGHPTTNQYAQQIVDKINSYRQAAPGPAPAPAAQPAMQPEGYDPRDYGAAPGQAPAAQSEGYDPRDYGVAPPYKTDKGEFMRGVKHSWEGFPMLASGAVAGAGASLESAVGEGGIATDIKNWGLEGYQDYQNQRQITSKDSDSMTYSWEQAKQGNYGALVDWAQYGLGHVVTNLLPFVGIAKLGAAAGGLFFKNAVDKTVRGLVKKEMVKLNKEKFKGSVRKQAVKNVASTFGKWGAVGATGTALEMGEIGGGLAEQTVERGSALSGEEVARGVGWGLAAGSAEFAANVLGLKGLFGDLKLGKHLKSMPGWKGKAARGGSVAPIVGLGEGATEGFQHYAEEAGMGHPWDENTRRGAIDSAALGAMSGPVVGAYHGAFSRATPEAAPETASPVGESPPSPQSPPASPLAGTGTEQVESNPGVREAYEEQAWFRRNPQADTVPELTVSEEASYLASLIFPGGKKSALKQSKEFKKLYEAAATTTDAQALEAAEEYLRTHVGTGKIVEAERAIATLQERYRAAAGPEVQPDGQSPPQPFTQVETRPGPVEGENYQLPGIPAYEEFQPDTVVANSDHTPIPDRLSAQRRSWDAAQEEKAALARGDHVGAGKIREQAIAQTGAVLGEPPVDEVGILQDRIRNERNTAYDQHQKKMDKYAQELAGAKVPVRKRRIQNKIESAGKAWDVKEQRFLDRYHATEAFAGPDQPLPEPGKVPGQGRLSLRKQQKPRASSPYDTSGRKHFPHTPGKRGTVEKVEGWIAHLAEEFHEITNIKTVPSFSALPERLRKHLPADSRGAFDYNTDTIYLVADAIYSQEEAVFVAMHEGVHRGLDSVFGPGADLVLQQIYHSNPGIKENVDHRMAVNPALDLTDAIEEELADMAYENVDYNLLNGWDSLVKLINDWIAAIWSKLTGTKNSKPMVFTDELVEQLLTGLVYTGLDAKATPASEATARKLKASVAAAIDKITVDDVKKVLSSPNLDNLKEVKTAVQDKVLKDFSTLGQMVDVVKGTLPSAEAFDQAIRRMQATANSIVNLGTPVATRWRGLSEAQDAILTNLITDSETAGMRPDRAFTDPSNEWGRTVKEPAEAAAKEEYGKLKHVWNQLSKDAQKVYTDQLNLSTTVLGRVVEGMKKNIRDSVADEETRNKMLSEIDERWKYALQGRPYIPHRRYGKYIVIVTDSIGNREVWGYETEAQAKREAKEHLTRFKNDPKVEMRSAGESFSNLDGADRTFINKLKQHITQGMSAAEADRVQKNIEELYVAALPEMSGAKRLLKRKNVKGWSTKYIRSWSESIMAMSRYSAKLEHMDDMRNAIEDAGREAGVDKTIYAVTSWDTTKKSAPLTTNFFNTAAAKTNYVHSKLSKDKNIEYRSYNSRKAAVLEQVHNHYIARLGPDNGDKAFEAVKAAAEKDPNTVVREAPEDEVQATRFYNILRDRYSRLLSHNPRGPVSSFMVNLGFMYYLGWTPAFAFMNVTQVSMLTLPRLASEYGIKDATAAIWDAYKFTAANKDVFVKLSAGAFSADKGSSVLTISDFKDIDGAELSEEYQALLQQLLDLGKLDFTQGSELYEVAEDTNKAVAVVTRSASWLAHPTEVINRIVTARATYDLAKAKGKGSLAAQKEAIEVLDTTQYDYSKENRPLVLQHPWARVALQFRQFSQQTAWQIGRVVYKAMDENLSKSERQKQKMYLLWLLASTFTLAGIRGMPAAGAILILASALFGDEGEDFEVDMQAWFRENFGEVLGPMMTDGMFTSLGVDASGQIGLGDLVPGTNISTRAGVGGRDRVADMLFDLAGPAAAMTGNWYEGFSKMSREGSYYEGIETMLPKAFRTPMTAYRQSVYGMTTKSGIVRIEPGDMTPIDFIATAAGMKTQKVSQMQGKVRAIQGLEDVLNFRSRLIRKKVQLARKADDIEAEMDALEELEKFNEKYPHVKITQRSLLNKVQQAAQRRASATGGVATTKRQELLYDRWIADEEDLQ